jgi:sporulation protein YlmC with PRC-barrel domain
MKLKPLLLFAGLIFSALCLAAHTSLRADNISSQVDPTKHHQYANPDGKSVFLDPNNVMPGHYNYDYVVSGPTPALAEWPPTPIAVGAPAGGYQQQTAVAAPTGNPSGQGTAVTPAPSDQSQAPDPVNRASHLIGMTVKNQQNQTLGKIKDVVLDLQNSRVSYVVLQKAGQTQGTGSNLAIPLSHFTPSADRQSLILNSDLGRIENSTGFSDNNLPAMSDPAFGAQPEQPVRREILIVPIPSSELNRVQPDNPAPDSDLNQKPDMQNP